MFFTVNKIYIIFLENDRKKSDFHDLGKAAFYINLCCPFRHRWQ